MLRLGQLFPNRARAVPTVHFCDDVASYVLTNENRLSFNLEKYPYVFGM